VKALRDATGAGMMDCKRALQQSEGDFAKAKDLLREWGMASAKKLSERAADQGVVYAYLHQPDLDMPPKVGTLIELNCATDFVAKTEAFQDLARQIAMHITAARPMVVERDDLPADVVAKEKELIAKQAEQEGKPAEVIDKIVEGKMQVFYADNVLLDQPYTRDTSKTIARVLDEATASLREPVRVKRFSRFRVGAE
jgi:elongation factor Ts